METHVCISTANQVVNLLPALQMKAGRIVLISSDEAEKRHWTANLKWVCQRKNLPLTRVPISKDKEMEPDQMTSVLPADLSSDQVVWNISGGKKSMTLGMLRSMSQLGGRVIYTENRPYRIVEYDGFRYLRKVDMDHFLDLEDLLNLNGFSLHKMENSNLPLTSVLEHDWASEFSELYRNHNRFQEMLNRLFAFREVDLREKENIVDAVGRVLNQNKPKILNLVSGIQDFDQNTMGQIRKAVSKCQSSAKKDMDIFPILKICTEFYWNHFKKKIVPMLSESLQSPINPLLEPAPNKAEINELVYILKRCGGSLADETKGFQHGNVRLPQKPGECFEKIVASEFLRVLKENGLQRFIDHVRLNVKTKALSYGIDGDVIEGDVYSGTEDDEFDIVIVTPWGSLHIFEIKTYYGKGGDVLKSSRDSALTKGGIFGGITFIDPLLKSRKCHKSGNFPSFFDRNLAETRSLIQRIGLKAWCFDEIEPNLLQMLN